jgi:hypothetical protein
VLNVGADGGRIVMLGACPGRGYGSLGSHTDGTGWPPGIKRYQNRAPNGGLCLRLSHAEPCVALCESEAGFTTQKQGGRKGSSLATHSGCRVTQLDRLQKCPSTTGRHCGASGPSGGRTRPMAQWNVDAP